MNVFFVDQNARKAVEYMAKQVRLQRQAEIQFKGLRLMTLMYFDAPNIEITFTKEKLVMIGTQS
jgi:hypothetical protein